MKRYEKKLETEIQELYNKGELSAENIINLFKKYEESNIKLIEKLKRPRLLEKRKINGALKQTINAHGPIDSKLIGSASKRISGALINNDKPTLTFNFNSFLWGVIIGSAIIILLQ